MFQVGDEVVCVNTSYDAMLHPTYKGYVDQLVLQQIYVVAEIRPAKISGKSVVCFDNFLWHTGQRFGFSPDRFRKVQKKFSGMNVLHGLLKTQSKELVDVV